MKKHPPDTLPRATEQRLAALDAKFARSGLYEHLEAVRDLARDEQLDAETIEFMMRGLFSIEDIKALMAEARRVIS